MDYFPLTPLSVTLSFIAACAELFMIISIINASIKLKSFIMYSLIFTILMTVIRLIVPTSFCWIFAVGIAIPLLILFTQLLWKRLVFAYLINMLIVIILDCSISFTLIALLKIPNFDSIPLNIYYLDMILVYSFSFLIALIIRLFKLSKNKFDEVKSIYVLINTIFTTTLIVPNIFILVFYFNEKSLPLWIIFLNIISIILMFLMNLYNTNKRVELVRYEEELAYQKNYNSTLQNLVDGLRTFKHDYSNTLQTINGYIQLENIPALKKLMSQILDESKAINSLDKLNPDLIKNPSILGLITAKYQLCVKNDISMNFEILGNLENLNIQIFHLTRILGIFLDNAVEASTESKEKNINFLVRENENFVIIEISNSYLKTSLSTKEMFEKGVSSKGTGRGLGLYEVNKILSKTPNVLLETISDENFFLQKLIISK